MSETSKKPATSGAFDGTPVDVMTHEEKDEIRRLLAEGKTQKEIAELTDRDPRSIRKVMKLNAAMARTDVKIYDPVARGRLINLTFEKFEEILLFCRDGFQLRALISGLKELCDIRRMEEGLAPSEHLTQFQMNIVVQGQRPADDEDDLPDIVDGTFTREADKDKPIEEVHSDEPDDEYDPLKDV